MSEAPRKRIVFHGLDIMVKTRQGEGLTRKAYRGAESLLILKYIAGDEARLRREEKESRVP